MNSTKNKTKTLKKLTASIVILGISVVLFVTFSSLALGSSVDIPKVGSDDIQTTEYSADTTADQVSEEPARYNFASVQGASNLQVVPGGEVKATIRFYNVDGNRTTHITLEIAQIPDSWEVEIVTQNLHAEPTELSPEPIEDVPDGMVCLTVGNRGYTLAKEATITIRVPESAQADTTGQVKITAVASWLGQEGQASICQTRDFDYSVKTLSVNE